MSTKDRWIRKAEGVYWLNGRYKVRWWEPDGNGGGARKQETLPAGTTLKQAKEFKADKEKRKRRRGRNPDATCDAFVKLWTEEYARPSESTNIQNAERVSKFGQDFKGRLMRDIDRAEARLWHNRNPSRFKAVRAMFNDALRDGYVDENPFMGIRGRDVERGRHDIVVLTEPEINRLMEIARDLLGDYGTVVAGLIGAAAWTGARPGELFALEWPDIDFTNRTLYLTEAISRVTNEPGSPKWNSKRKMALLPQAEEVFRSLPRHPFSQVVFWAQRTDHFSARSFHYYWSRVRAVFWAELPAARKAHTQEEAVRDRKIEPGFDFYELRHFFGSYLANVLHATPQEIAKQMGHKDGGRLAMRLYIHTEEDDANASILERAGRVAEERERERKTG